MLYSLLQSSSYLLCGLIIAATLILILLKFYSSIKVSDLLTKHVLITGCDSGFGRETAIRLDQMGVNVLATCLTKEGEQSLKSVTSAKLKTFLMDVTSSQQIQTVFRKVNEMLPPEQGLWGLVNNAGIGSVGPIEWIPLDEMKRVADVNLWGVIDVTKNFLPLVKKARGRVVNLASMYGRIAPSLGSIYSITKHGVEAFSDALRREMRPWGVQVSIIEPGFFKTGVTDPVAAVRSLHESWDKLSPELKDDYGEGFLQELLTLVREKLGGISPDTFKVVNAVIDALTSTCPRSRYTVGMDAKINIFLNDFLPTYMTDFLMRIQQSSFRR